MIKTKKVSLTEINRKKPKKMTVKIKAGGDQDGTNDEYGENWIKTQLNSAPLTITVPFGETIEADDIDLSQSPNPLSIKLATTPPAEMLNKYYILTVSQYQNTDWKLFENYSVEPKEIKSGSYKGKWAVPVLEGYKCNQNEGKWLKDCESFCDIQCVLDACEQATLTKDDFLEQQQGQM